METFLFICALVVLMGANVFVAPLIVREQISFKLCLLVLTGFYVWTCWQTGKDAPFYVLLAVICFLSSAFALLLGKRRQHNPDKVDGENKDFLQKQEMAKIYCYKQWFFKNALANVFFGVITLIYYCLL